MNKFFAILFISILGITISKGQNPDELFDMSLEELLKLEITVSSTKGKNVFNTPSTVTVIDHDMLHQYNFLTVAEMLRNVVGLDIYQTNIEDNVPTSRGILQNFYANKILVMINNVPNYNVSQHIQIEAGLDAEQRMSHGHKLYNINS